MLERVRAGAERWMLLLERRILLTSFLGPTRDMGQGCSARSLGGWVPDVMSGETSVPCSFIALLALCREVRKEIKIFVGVEWRKMVGVGRM